MAAHSFRIPVWLQPVLVAVAAVALYGGTLDNPFISDDVLVTIDNPQVQSLSRIPDFFVHDFDRILPDEGGSPEQPSSRFGLYRPVLAASFALSYTLSGLDPTGWRLVNLLLHLAASLLLYAVGRRLLESRVAGLAAALLFAAHPIHTEAVASLVGGRAELLASVSVLGAWWLFLAGDYRTGRPRLLTDLGSAGVFALGLLAKENAAVLPGVLFLAGWVLRRRSVRELLVRLAPHLLILAGYLLLRLVIIGGITSMDRTIAFGRLPPADVFLGVMAILATYLRLVLIPWPLQDQLCYHDLPARIPAWLGLVCTLLVVGLIAVASWRAIRGRRAGRTPFAAFGLLLFYGCLFPVSHVVPFMVVMAERFCYLPSVAACLVAGWALQELLQRGYRLPLVAGCLLLVVFSALTLHRNADWAAPERYWSKTARCAPGAAAPYNNLGTAALRKGRTAEALSRFQQAARLEPSNPRPHHNLGLALQRLGRIEEAEQAYRRALRAKPDHDKALNNLGLLLMERGRMEQAQVLFERAIQSNPVQPAPYVNLGTLHQRAGRTAEAERLFRAALRLAPSSSEAAFDLARLLGRSGRQEEAEALYRRLLAHDPDHALAWNNLANILKHRGAHDRADKLYRKALQADPACAPAHYNLANLLLSRNFLREAARHFERATALAPDMLEAWLGLAYANLGMNDPDRARRAAQKAQQLAAGDPRVQALFERLDPASAAP